MRHVLLSQETQTSFSTKRIGPESWIDHTAGNLSICKMEKCRFGKKSIVIACFTRQASTLARPGVNNLSYALNA